jgi:DNA-binding transcriptional LysR family regulator
MVPQGWSQIDLRHLIALRAVARERSFAEAAAALGYTQSAISQQMAALERTVGHRLIERPGGRRRVWLTEAGELLLAHADTVVTALQEASSDLAALGEGRAGRLRVGTYQSVGSRILPAIVRRFHVVHSGIELEVREPADDEELFAMLARGELDLSFALLPPPEDTFDGIELMHDPYVLLVAADAPLADSTAPPTLRDIERLPLIGFRACRQERWLELHFDSQGIRPTWAFRTDDNATMQAMVGVGVGAALVPRLTIDPTDPETVAIELGDLVPPRRLGLVWMADRTRSAPAEGFIALAREVIEALPGHSPASRPAV